LKKDKKKNQMENVIEEGKLDDSVLEEVSGGLYSFLGEEEESSWTSRKITTNVIVIPKQGDNS